MKTPILMPVELVGECERLVFGFVEAYKEITATALGGAARGKVGWDVVEVYTDEELMSDVGRVSDELTRSYRESLEACQGAPLQGVSRKKILDLIVYLIFALLRTKP